VVERSGDDGDAGVLIVVPSPVAPVGFVRTCGQNHTHMNMAGIDYSSIKLLEVNYLAEVRRVADRASCRRLIA
jgi:hypothetical protein